MFGLVSRFLDSIEVLGADLSALLSGSHRGDVRYDLLARSNFIIAKLREKLSRSVLYHEKGSSVGAFNSVSIAGPEAVGALNFYALGACDENLGFLRLPEMLVSVWSSPDGGTA